MPEGCRPLSKAVEQAVVSSDVLRADVSANGTFDVLDIAVSAILGFTAVDAESLARHVLDGLEERPSGDQQPDDWDEEEDGTWEAEMLPAKPAHTLLQEILQREDDNSSGLKQAYTFSSSPMMIRYRSGLKAADGPAFDCTDFSAVGGEATPAIGAVLFADDAGGKGGEAAFPALDLRVAPKAGRLLLFELLLPDGSCDPAMARASLPLASRREGKLVFQKLYYSDPSHSRERSDKEGPQAGPTLVHCEDDQAIGCRRYEHIPAPSGDAVLPLRSAADALRGGRLA